MAMSDSRQIRIFDTTLRDGQQCPGAGMSFEKNLEYARMAADLGVDVLEAGFASASKVDFEIVRTIANELSGKPNSPIIASLSPTRSEHIDLTIEALQPAVLYGRARLHIYLPVDPALMPASLGDRCEDKARLIAEVHEYCARAVAAGLEVEFSPEGYSRMGENFDFVSDAIRAAVDAGATIINCPDTIGGACIVQGEEYFVRKMQRHAEIISREFPDRQVTWSTHCHNDFGLAVINSINAVFFGPARQIEGCINGIGERAGNTAIEQCILIIRHFSAMLDAQNPFYTNINTDHIQRISDFVSTHMLPRQPHWPIGGSNAAKHSAGGHTNAILRNPLVYQPFDPRETGTSISFLFGPLSGGNHARDVITRAGYRVEEAEKAEIAQFIKELYAERRKGITDQELLAGYFEFRKPIRLSTFDYARSKNTSEVRLQGTFFTRSGEIHDQSEGKDSALATLKKAIDSHYPGLSIDNYQSESVGSGINALSRSTIIVSENGQGRFEGIGEDQDIEISAMKALIDATNRAYIEQHYRIRQSSTL